jgi:hypothetical protein
MIKYADISVRYPGRESTATTKVVEWLDDLVDRRRAARSYGNLRDCVAERDPVCASMP